MANIYKHLAIMMICIGCASHKTHYVENYQSEQPNQAGPDYSILFFGGADKTPDNIAPAILALNEQLKTIDKGSLILLGNNGAKRGLTDSTHNKIRQKTETVIRRKIDMLSSFGGDIYMLPGNHDWDDGGKQGYERILLLEEYVEDVLGLDQDVVVPSGACPGPYEVHVRDDLVLLFLNTQWWLHEWNKPGPGGGCDMEDDFDFIVKLDDAIQRNINKKIIIAGHHPLFSNGPHGGYFPAYTHFLPPVLGSLYAWYRKHVGGLQDLADIKYKTMSKGIISILQQHPNLVYLSGHERSLQYHLVSKQHYVVSGAIAQASAVVKGNNARFASGRPGFGKLNFYDNGDVFLEFWGLENGKIKVVFSEKLFNHIYDPSLEQLDTRYQDLDYSGQTTNAVATTKLNRKKGKERPGLLGSNYRKEWATEMQDVPLFDIGSEQGGLEIVQRGGGLQTKSLRLENKDEKQYVLRSIEKFPERAVPSALRETVVADLVADQVSASHPYGAFVVPPMASAAGIYHTNPKLVYVPEDPRFGNYQDDFGNGLYLYEERPAKDRRELNSFGNSKKIVSTLDVIKDSQKNHKHHIDQSHVLRSRLFDIFIGDWDRHDDQWRWASFKNEDDRTYYQPIPRDRDQTFFWSDGTILKLISRKWGEPKFQGFHSKIRDIEGLGFNARFFDRSFLTQPSKEDWISMAEELKDKLDDQTIENAIRKFPDEIYNLNGETIIRKLKQRRDDLPQYASKYYLFLAENVDVVGTNKRERFEVSRLNDAETEVKLYQTTKNDSFGILTYQRTFKTDETEEVRLYGLGGDDIFTFTGNVNKGSKIRVIGGKGEDELYDDSRVKGGKSIIAYDRPEKITINSDGEVRNKTSDKDPLVNTYNRMAFKYNVILPQLYGGFNPDDGLFFGGGASFINHKFRKEPFGRKHSVRAAVAPKSGSFNLRYIGEYTDVIGNWDLLMALDFFRPGFADFFYGMGNQTAFDEQERDEDTQFYRARYENGRVGLGIRNTSKNKLHTLRLGTYFRTVSINTEDNDSKPNRFIIQYADLIDRGADSESPLLDMRRNYLASNVHYALNTRNSDIFPIRGLHWVVDGRAVWQIGDEANRYQNISSNISTYFTFGGSLRTTVAIRAGGSANFGDFEFYQAPRLGGFNYLRGYRRARFAGDETVYQNTELRIRLMEYQTPLFPGSFGITLLHDIGRVWTDMEDDVLIDESKAEWHRGYGGGIWIAPLGQAVISFDYSVSNDDEEGIFVRLGFFF
jgi:hypothetical protein